MQVPLTVVHREGLPLDGTAPALLVAYGAYGECLAPDFEVSSGSHIPGVRSQILQFAAMPTLAQLRFICVVGLMCCRGHCNWVRSAAW